MWTTWLASGMYRKPGNMPMGFSKVWGEPQGLFSWGIPPHFRGFDFCLFKYSALLVVLCLAFRPPLRTSDEKQRGLLFYHTGIERDGWMTCLAMMHHVLRMDHGCLVKSLRQHRGREEHAHIVQKHSSKPITTLATFDLTRKRNPFAVMSA